MNADSQIKGMDGGLRMGTVDCSHGQCLNADSPRNDGMDCGMHTWTVALMAYDEMECQQSAAGGMMSTGQYVWQYLDMEQRTIPPAHCGIIHPFWLVRGGRLVKVKGWGAELASCTLAFAILVLGRTTAKPEGSVGG